jgi:hypothetical protein
MQVLGALIGAQSLARRVPFHNETFCTVPKEIRRTNLHNAKHLREHGPGTKTATHYPMRKAASNHVN